MSKFIERIQNIAQSIDLFGTTFIDPTDYLDRGLFTMNDMLTDEIHELLVKIGTTYDQYTTMEPYTKMWHVALRPFSQYGYYRYNSMMSKHLTGLDIDKFNEQLVSVISNIETENSSNYWSIIDGDIKNYLSKIESLMEQDSLSDHVDKLKKLHSKLTEIRDRALISSILVDDLEIIKFDADRNRHRDIFKNRDYEGISTLLGYIEEYHDENTNDVYDALSNEIILIFLNDKLTLEQRDLLMERFDIKYTPELDDRLISMLRDEMIDYKQASYVFENSRKGKKSLIKDIFIGKGSDAANYARVARLEAITNLGLARFLGKHLDQANSSLKQFNREYEQASDQAHRGASFVRTVLANYVVNEKPEELVKFVKANGHYSLFPLLAIYEQDVDYIMDMSSYYSSANSYLKQDAIDDIISKIPESEIGEVLSILLWKGTTYNSDNSTIREIAKINNNKEGYITMVQNLNNSYRNPRKVDYTPLLKEIDNGNASIPNYNIDNLLYMTRITFHNITHQLLHKKVKISETKVDDIKLDVQEKLDNVASNIKSYLETYISLTENPVYSADVSAVDLFGLSLMPLTEEESTNRSYYYRRDNLTNMYNSMNIWLTAILYGNVDGKPFVEEFNKLVNGNIYLKRSFNKVLDELDPATMIEDIMNADNSRYKNTKKIYYGPERITALPNEMYVHDALFALFVEVDGYQNNREIKDYSLFENLLIEYFKQSNDPRYDEWVVQRSVSNLLFNQI